MSAPLFGAVEAGGTKFLVSVGEQPTAPRDIVRIATNDDPSVTLAEVVRYFERYPKLAAIGVASFGPVDFVKGGIGPTPKPGWGGFPLVEAISKPLGTKVTLDTDVNGAALGEVLYGSGQGLDSFVYITVGTGIGGGAVVGGRTLHGLLHPEMGHLPLRRHPEEPAGFHGVCPFHGDCLEGMASGTSMRARWGASAETLPDDHLAWRIEAYYLAQACFAMSCMLSPQRIAIGGGVAARAALLPLVREQLKKICAGYLPLPEIVAPTLEYPALCGALAMAQHSIE